MSDQPRRKPPVVSIALAVAGFALGLLGYVYGGGCDFDTMLVCRPLGLFTGDSFVVSATGGLLLMGGALLFLIGGAGLLLHGLRGRLAPLSDV